MKNIQEIICKSILIILKISKKKFTNFYSVILYGK